MQFVRIPPEKLAEFEALKREFDGVQKALEAISDRINSIAVPVSDDVFVQFREMRRQLSGIRNQMLALASPPNP